MSLKDEDAIQAKLIRERDEYYLRKKKRKPIIPLAKEAKKFMNRKTKEKT
tara:strand:+ start:815 stop:964 length:150 start_codon:yes stop_codon:yes gene_type:complete